MSIDRMDAPVVDLTAAEPCSDCGFSASALAPEEAAVALRALPQRWRSTLAPDRAQPPAGTASQPPAGLGPRLGGGAGVGAPAGTASQPPAGLGPRLGGGAGVGAPAGTASRIEREVLLTGRPPGGWSALEHAGHVRDVLHALDIRLQRVLREDRPVLPGTHVTPPAGANEQGMAVVLAALAVSAEQLARTIEAATASSWSRGALRAGRRITALELVHEAVHAGWHHLGRAQEAIETVRESAASAQP